MTTIRSMGLVHWHAFTTVHVSNYSIHGAKKEWKKGPLVVKGDEILPSYIWIIRITIYYIYMDYLYIYMDFICILIYRDPYWITCMFFFFFEAVTWQLSPFLCFSHQAFDVWGRVDQSLPGTLLWLLWRCQRWDGGMDRCEDDLF